ncbi:MAG: DUF58 domain-containing protein [Planctomycetes bacterium]|nr:DUF58 domain-containing protein [Planctomycetota bacterium]
MIFTDRVIILLFVGAVIMAVGLIGPMVQIGDAELGRVALVLGAGIDAVVFLLLALDRQSLGRGGDQGHQDVVVRRVTEDILSQGAPNVARILIENHTDRPVRLSLTDTLPASFEVGDALPLETIVPAASRAELSYLFTPMVRGDFELGSLHVRRYGRLNLVVRQDRRPARRRVSVYPDIYGVARSRQLLARAGRKSTGLRRMRVLGEGREFHRLRPYVQGDDTRLIDWKATAKHRQPTVREFELERNQRLVVAIDVGRLMTAEVDGLTKLDHAVAAAMGLANVALLSGDRVGLLIFSKDVRVYLPPRKGAGQFRLMVDVLAHTEADLFEPDYGYALGYLAARLSRRSLVVMLTDLAAGSSNSAMVTRLSAMLPRHLPVCATIRDPLLVEAATAAPHLAFDAYRNAAAREVLRDQTVTRQVLSSRGVVTVDVDADKLLATLVNRYLDIKARGRL